MSISLPRSTIPASVDDIARLAALDDYGILDTPLEEGFDDIVLLATQACRTPVALVSLVGKDRQWFKARIGFPACGTDLDRSVCAHALDASDLLVIPDLTADPRTSANPLVTGEPHIRFYAGAPLRSPTGAVLGTLCVIDHEPRAEGLTERQAMALRALARQVVSQMELRRALHDRDRALVQREALTTTQAAVYGAGGDLDAALSALVAGAMRALPHAEGGVVELLDGDDLVYRSPAGAIADMAGLRLPVHASLAGSCVLTGEAILCPDVLADARVKRDLVERLHLRSCILLPVRVRDAVIGVLKLQSSHPNAFSEHDLAVAGPFAGVVTTGLSQVGEAAARRDAWASQDRYKAVFDSAIDYAIILLDLDGVVTDWNEGATRILGWKRGSMCGKPADTFFTPEDRDAGIPAKEMSSALETGRGVDERWHLRVNGERFWANGEMMVLRDEAGGAIGFVKMLRDRTEQRRSAEALQAQSELLRTITDYVGQAVFQMDGTGAITFTNPGAEAMFGWSSDEMLGRSLHALLHHSHPDGRTYPAHDCPLRHALVDGRLMEGVEDTFFRKDGAPVRALITNAPVLRDGRVASAVLTVTDITARKATERRLSLLAQASGALLSADDPAAALGPILEAGATDLGFDQSYTYDLAEDAAHLALTHSVGADEATRQVLRKVAFAVPLCGIVAETGHPVVLTDLQASADPRHALARGAGIQTYAGFPIRSHGTLRGVISFASNLVPAFDKDALAFFGTVARFLSIARERRESEAALRASETRLRATTDNAGIGIHEVDAQGRYLAVNESFSRDTGYTMEHLRGRGFLDLVEDPADRAAAVEEFDRLVRGDTKVYSDTREYVDLRGRRWTAQMRTTAVRDEAGRFLYGIRVVEDVTARTRTEARQAALLELGDRLRDLDGPAAIVLAAAEVVGRALGITRAGYGSVDPDAETVSVEQEWNGARLTGIGGLHRFRDFGTYVDALKLGETVVVDDITADPCITCDVSRLDALSARGFVNIPLMRRDRCVGLFFVHSERSRAWTGEEITFLRNVADSMQAAIARAAAEEHQDLLNRELSHRMKNLLAMVQAIATQTLRNAGDVREARDVLNGRLLALGKAHDLLMGGALTSTGMEPVIRGALQIHADGPDRFRLEGPPTDIGPDAAMSLSLTLHELATNAAKYGALSTGGGHVDIRWDVRPAEAGPKLELSWAEVGGPPVRPPTRTGFGSRFIQRGLTSQVGGTLAIDYPESGVTFRVEAPLASFQASCEAQAA